MGPEGYPEAEDTSSTSEKASLTRLSSSPSLVDHRSWTVVEVWSLSDTLDISHLSFCSFIYSVYLTRVGVAPPE